MTSKDKNSATKTTPQKYMPLTYYGGITSLGALPKDPNWVKEFLRFFGIGKARPSDQPQDDKTTPDY